jgi:hypothetical protein
LTNPQKSESSDEFLKRNNIDGYDPTVVDSEQKPTIDTSQIPALNQPKEKGSAAPCKKCEEQ